MVSAGAASAVLSHQLQLIGITYNYNSDPRDGDFKLARINLTLDPGEVIFISGGNGSGKTTLAKILTGLYAPTLRMSGKVHLEGEALSTVTALSPGERK